MRLDRLLVLGTLLLPAACNRQAPPAAGGAQASPTVVVVKPVKKAIERVIEQPGTVRPAEETRLYAKIPGFVKAIGTDPAIPADGGRDRRIDIGSRVTGGQVLAEIAIPEVEQEAKQKAALVKQAEAEIEQAKKAVAAADAAVASAQAQVAEAKAGVARAQALYDRWRAAMNQVAGLVKGGVVATENSEEITYQFKAAEAARGEVAAKVASAEAAARKAQADRDKADADVTAADARLEVAKAEVGRLAALLGYTRITAPFDGVVTHRAVNTGDFLSVAGRDGMFRVARLDPVRVVIQVPEADAGLVREGHDVRLTVQALDPPTRTGKVTRTSWSLEAGSRTLRAEVDLPNEKGAIRPGMYVYARIAVPLPEGLGVPAAAVGKAGDDFVVYLVEGGKAVRTPVQLGRGDGHFTQLRRYKKPGAVDWIEFTGAEPIATPAAALSDGQSVQVPPS